MYFPYTPFLSFSKCQTQSMNRILSRIISINLHGRVNKGTMSWCLFGLMSETNFKYVGAHNHTENTQRHTYTHTHIYIYYCTGVKLQAHKTLKSQINNEILTELH